MASDRPDRRSAVSAPASPRSRTRSTFDDELADQRRTPRRPGERARSRARRRSTTGRGAASRSGAPTRAATPSTRSSSSRSRRVAVSESTRCSLDEEQHEVGGRRRQSHRLRGLPRDPNAGRDVVALARLADVVQQRTEQQRVAVGHGLGRARGERVVARIGEQSRDAGERLEQVHVDRRPVVRIALRPASDRGPRREVAHEQPEPVERLERARRLGTRPKQLEERVAHVVGPRIRSGSCAAVDRVQRRPPA